MKESAKGRFFEKGESEQLEGEKNTGFVPKVALQVNIYLPVGPQLTSSDSIYDLAYLVFLVVYQQTWNKVQSYNQ